MKRFTYPLVGTLVVLSLTSPLGAQLAARTIAEPLRVVPSGVVNGYAKLTVGQEWYHDGQTTSYAYRRAAVAVGTEGEESDFSVSLIALVSSTKFTVEIV